MIVNSLVVRYRNGQTLVEDAASIATYGRRQAYLELGQVESLTEAQSIANLELDRVDAPQDRIRLDVNPRGTIANRVYQGWTVGDFVNSLDRSGSAATYRVREIKVAQDDESGEIEVEPTLNSRLEEFSERVARIIKRRADGTLDGRSSSTGTAPPADSVRVRRPEVQVGTFSFASETEAYIDVETPPYRFEQDGRLAWVQYSWNTPPAADATVVGKVDGTTTFTHTVPASQATYDVFPNTIIDRSEDLTWTVTDVDATASGLTIKAHLVSFT